jgi:hypothetical protein
MFVYLLQRFPPQPSKHLHSHPNMLRVLSISSNWCDYSKNICWGEEILIKTKYVYYLCKSCLTRSEWEGLHLIAPLIIRIYVFWFTTPCSYMGTKLSKYVVASFFCSYVGKMHVVSLLQQVVHVVTRKDWNCKGPWTRELRCCGLLRSEHW